MLVPKKPNKFSLLNCAFYLPIGFILFLFLRFSILEVSSRLYGRNFPINGHNEEQFEMVRDTFRSNFLEGFERDGASFAVYHRGKSVVNIYGGTSDTKSHKLWSQDTRTLLFSTTKAVSALTIALLVQQGHLNWDDKVAKYWPEYALNGKGDTTIQQVLSHQAGIPYIAEVITYSDALNISRVLDKIARSTPIWKPGKKTGYHALTFGWIVEAIVYHADPKHRHLGQFFKEEIADKYDVDISIGAESEKDFERSAVLSSPTNFDYFRDIVSDLRMLFMIVAYYFQPSNSILSLSAKNPHWISMENKNIAFNSYEIQRLKLGAVNGLSNAHDLARLFSLFINGSMVSQPILDQMRTPIVDGWHWEQTVLYPIMKGYGFFYEAHPTRPGKYVFGHPGYGCQSLHVDMEEQLVVVYLSNGLKSATSVLCRPYQRLLDVVYSSL